MVSRQSPTPACFLSFASNCYSVQRSHPSY